MKPTLLFYCQHAVGMGHLVRSLAIAGALARRFRVVLLGGGAMPRGLRVPTGVEIVALPPLALVSGRLIGSDRRRSVERTQYVRIERILDTFRALRPSVVVVELFPFGRRKFRFELLPLLQAARETSGPAPRPFVLCSVRDILVSRDNQDDFDSWAVEHANRYFDAVLVHADPTFARLEDHLRSRTPLRIPLHYTGFVTSDPIAPNAAQRDPTRRQVLVSAGGGAVGEPLLRAAFEAQPLLWESDRLPTVVVAGPFLPEATWRSLRAEARRRKGLVLRRFVPDLRAAMAGSAVSISQCGYNTAMDLLQARVPAVVVPFGEGSENEQLQRAGRLEELGVVRILDNAALSGATLAVAVREVLRSDPPRVELDLNGAANTLRRIESLLDAQITGDDDGPRGASSLTVRRRMVRTDGWLAPARHALDSAARNVVCFVRDDDVGWDDARLFATLERIAEHVLPIDLAVIPAAVTLGLARQVRERMGSLPINVHQHGYAHVNHEPEGRKCEFGLVRRAEEQRCDIERGAARLRELFGDAVQPIFTPPWNRCTTVTEACLLEVGFRVLSRDKGAAPLNDPPRATRDQTPSLLELNISVDWFAHRQGVRLTRPELGERIARAIGAGGPVGFMFHHTRMDDVELDAADDLFRLLAEHPRTTVRPMLEIACA